VGGQLCGEYSKQKIFQVGETQVVKVLPKHLVEHRIASRTVLEEDNSMSLSLACAFSTMATEALRDRFRVALKIKRAHTFRHTDEHNNGKALDLNVDCNPQRVSVPSDCLANPVYSWLRTQAQRLGFCRTRLDEVFHWEFLGKGCKHVDSRTGRPIPI